MNVSKLKKVTREEAVELARMNVKLWYNIEGEPTADPAEAIYRHCHDTEYFRYNCDLTYYTRA